MVEIKIKVDLNWVKENDDSCLGIDDENLNKSDIEVYYLISDSCIKMDCHQLKLSYHDSVLNCSDNFIGAIYKEYIRQKQ